MCAALTFHGRVRGGDGVIKKKMSLGGLKMKKGLINMALNPIIKDFSLNQK